MGRIDRRQALLGAGAAAIGALAACGPTGSARPTTGGEQRPERAESARGEAAQR